MASREPGSGQHDEQARPQDESTAHEWHRRDAGSVGDAHAQPDTDLAGATSAQRKVHFADCNQVFCVEKLSFCDLRGDTRDLQGTGDDPDWWSVGSARSRKLAEFAESFMLRKSFGRWHVFVCEGQTSESNAAHREGEPEPAGVPCAAAERRARRDDASPAAECARCPTNRSAGSAALAQPYYLAALGSSPPLPTSLSFRAFEFAATRVLSDDEEWSEEWSDWESSSVSESSSVRQSLDLVAVDPRS
jgi:hypothetical protein